VTGKLSKYQRNVGRAGLALMLASGLVACAQFEEARDPTMANLVLDETTVPEANRISIPMPQRQHARTPQRAEASSLWQTNTSSFFGDRRAKDIGDLLTVEIEINDKAQLSNTSERSRSNAQGAADPSFLGYGSQIDKILPGVDESDLPPGGNIIDLNSTSSTRGDGSIDRNEKISLRVAAVIIKVLPNGNFVIAGRQEVKVNKELRELRIAGLIRSMDLGLHNTISYEKVAEARIAYGGRGQLSVVQQPRYGQDFLEVILPY
jgi:flagellar L-ring protein precursor FlgH